MTDPVSRPATAFIGMRRLTQGPLADVAVAVKAAPISNEPVLVFDDATGKVIDLDLRGTDAEIVARLSPNAGEGRAVPRTPGRPRLGVIAREVTLLPRHWEWLTAQPGGASATLRRLVDDARRNDRSSERLARESCYRFLAAMAGDLPGFEEAARALFAGDTDAFAARMAAWPADVRAYARQLVKGATP